MGDTQKRGQLVYDRSGQVTIFIIVAILIVVGVALFFVFRSSTSSSDQVPASLNPVYSQFLSCVDDQLTLGVDVLLNHGGYIDAPSFEAGSAYAPFSSELNFLGTSVPYWSYISGNNLARENVPTIPQMESQLADFFDNRIRDCEFKTFVDQGFSIDLGTPSSRVDIQNDQVVLDLDMSFSASKGQDTVTVSEHRRSINSKLGALYTSALDVYQKEQREFFLENYSLDVLQFYAPVDGVLVQCSPEIWNADEVFDDVSSALEANILSLKGDKSDFSLSREENKYFVVDLGVDADVKFFTSKNWSQRFSVNPSEGSLLVAKPVGNQPGLNVLGFCYVPYHFVYDLSYPVLVQLTSGDETFQFPLVVVIEGNKPKESAVVQASTFESFGLCENQNVPTSITVHDASSRPVTANVSFECSYESCYIGEASSGTLTDDLPQCTNGIVVATAQGYKTARQVYSSVEQGSIDVTLQKVHDLGVQLYLDNRLYNGQAIVTFTSDDFSQSVVYPDTRSISLPAGEYSVETFVYRNTTLNLGASTVEQCVDVPRSGVGALLGLTKKECFEIDYPDQLVSNALVGGGKGSVVALDSDLSFAQTVNIYADDFGNPQSIEDLSQNYVLFEGSNVEVILV